MHQSSLDHMKDFREKFLTGRERETLHIYDLGSMDVNGSYRPIFEVPAWKYHGMDLSEGENVDIVLRDKYNWKEIPTNSVDVLISGQAFEHIEFFWITILEIARVLKPGGLCCLIAPSGGQEHRYPVDCWRFYRDGFAALAKFGRMKVLDVFTQKQEDAESDKSKIFWRDTVLICQKYQLKPFFEVRQRIWRALTHWVLTRRLPR